MTVIYALAVNLGTTHFVSFADFLVRGLFLPALLVFCVWGFINTTQDIRKIDLEQPYEEEEPDASTQEREYITCTCCETSEVVTTEKIKEEIA